MISMIFAMDKNNLIGKDNNLPWNYPEDLKYFKKVTSNNTVLMGEATFYSIYNRIGKPLPNRTNIVATLDPNFKRDDVVVTNDLISFLKEEREEEIFIIGGKQIYSLALPYADRLYITHINAEHEGNVYFPTIDYSKYTKIREENVGVLSFCIYERKKENE